MRKPGLLQSKSCLVRSSELAAEWLETFRCHSLLTVEFYNRFLSRGGTALDKMSKTSGDLPDAFGNKISGLNFSFFPDIDKDEC